MSTWWCALDKEYCSYNELKRRKVVAQGWPEIEDLSLLFHFIPKNKKYFLQVVNLLAEVIYKNLKPKERKDKALRGAAPVLWNLLNLKKGDLIVGIEGTIVKGICELKTDALGSYKYDSKYKEGYAQTIGFPVRWIDWNEKAFKFTPRTPARSVQGIKRLNQDKEKLLKAWNEYK
jgi:hypothetical protein